MLTAKLTISSPEFANPIVIPVADFNFGFPGNADLKVRAISPKGSTVTEQIDMDLSVEGYQIVTNKEIADFPIDVAGTVGKVVAALIESVDATITFEASLGAPPVA